MSVDYIILFLQLLQIRVTSMLECSSTKCPRTRKKEEISSEKSWNGYSRLLSLVLIRVYEFRLARGVLLSECVRAHDVGGDGVG